MAVGRAARAPSPTLPFLPHPPPAPRLVFDDGADAGDRTPSAAAPSSTAHHPERHFRGTRVETPSHAGGVNAAAAAAIEARARDRREREGLAAGSTRDRDRDRRDRRDRDRRRDRSRSRSRDRDRRAWSDRDRRPRTRSPPRRGWTPREPRGSAWAPASAPLPVRAGTAGGGAVRPPTGPRFGPPRPVGGDADRSRARADHHPSSRAARRPSASPPPAINPVDDAAYAAAAGDVDRAWYDDDEGGALARGDDSYLPDESSRFAKRAAAATARLTRADGSRMSLAASARASDARRDADAWEADRLAAAGLGGPRGALDDVDDGERLILLVHDARPPFLAGKAILSRQAAPVLPLRDPTSDMAVIARSGSALVKAVRAVKDASKSRARFWEMAGSKMGAATGLTADEKAAGDAAAEAASVEGGGDGKEKAATYKDAMGAAVAQSTFAKTKTLAEQRAALPVAAVRDDLLQAVREHQVVVVVGETGSGKTTQMAQYLAEDGHGARGIIGCTQPRRVAAMSVAARVAAEVGVELGREVGYAIRFEDVTSDATRIKFMTDGVLLRETLRDPDLDSYAAIIMDEAHERSLNTDVLFGILKKVVTRRRDFKLIVTSATLDAGKFASFFGGVPVFSIPGRTFPVDVLFSRVPQEDYVEAAVKQALAVHLGQPAGDILIFMTGQEEIDATATALSDRHASLGDRAPPLLILPIYSQLPADLQAKIFAPAPNGERKIVISTNIAETSLTVDGVKYVVDTGYCKLKVYNPRLGMDALQVFPCSQAAAGQRAGRAGRTSAGVCWRLFTEGAYKHEMLAASVPEIQRTNLGNVVLLLKSLNVDDLLHFDFMDPPPADNIAASLYSLWALGALDDAGGLTRLGRRMVEFPLDPALAALLLAGCDAGCGAECLTIVAMLSVPPAFFRPPDRADESDAAREKFFVPESDHLTLLHVFTQWETHGRRGEWCAQHFLQGKTLRKAAEVRSQLADIAAQQRLPLDSCGGDWDAVRRAICAAYFVHAARFKAVGEYVDCRSGAPAHLHPSSALYGLGYTPDYVVYHELIATQKEYMQCVTAVEPEWLADAGPAFFSIKTSHTSRLEAAARAKAASRAATEAAAARAATAAAGGGAAGAAAAAAARARERSAIVTPGARPGTGSQAGRRRTFGL